MARSAVMSAVRFACVVCAAIGCGGESGEPVVEFAPISCGRIGCDFDQRIGVGGVIGVQIRLAGGASVVGLEVRSRQPAILGAVQVADVAGQPTWELEAISPGVAVLEAVDPADGEGDDEEILDTFEVEVAAVDRIGLVNFIGDAAGPDAAEGYDELWTVPAGLPVSFRVTPFIDGASTMGRYTYQVELDPAIFNGLIDSVVDEGRLHFIPEAKDMPATWTDELDRELRVLIRGE